MLLEGPNAQVIIPSAKVIGPACGVVIGIGNAQNVLDCDTGEQSAVVSLDFSETEWEIIID
jgi:hypothetical protein